ncbi:MAG: hypothetical protein OEW75_15400 [Cyclobacteriaceae bacterium]|nr:hypothetical protein [Cyclobacteriaceae bacterium]
MKLFTISLILIALNLTSCTALGIGGKSNSGRTVNAFKPKKHRRPFDPKKDKKTKRLRIVKMKS